MLCHYIARSMFGGIVLDLFFFQRDHCLRALAEEHAQFFLPHIIGERLNRRFRLLFIRLICTDVLIQPRGKQRAHGALDAMQIHLRAKLQSAHIPYMGEIMLYARSWTRNAGIGHRYSADDKPLKDSLNRRIVPAQQSFGIIHALLQRRAHQFRHRFAVVFACDQMRNTPLCNAHILGQHITKSCLEHMFRRMLENIDIADDYIRTAGIQRRLETVHRHGRRCRSIAIHRRCSRDDDILSAGNTAEDLADIVDDAGTHTDDQVAAMIKMHDGRSYRSLVRLKRCLRKDIAATGDSMIRKQLVHTLSCRLIGIAVHQNKWLFASVFLKQPRNLADHAMADNHLIYSRHMRSAACTRLFVQLQLHQKSPFARDSS